MMRFSRKEAKQIGNIMGMTFSKDEYSLSEFTKGINVEQEHADVVDNDSLRIGRIAQEHLDEVPNYYSLLERYVEAK